jgi:hypothetical protein
MTMWYLPLYKSEHFPTGNGSAGSAVKYFLSAAVSWWIISCAGQVSPSGGPPDRVPPIVISTTPDTNTVRVSTKEITLEFSKYVDRRSVEESIFISPYLGKMEFKWSGREVVIQFKDSLRAHTTYVVNIGTDVVDLRERNRMGSGFTLAFSTGDSIDRGIIRGRVYDSRPEGVMIFAYLLDGINPDTLDPTRAKPDFIMQTGQGGTFTLSNLALGRYRVFAVRDEYRNLVYDKEIDEIGVPAGDVLLGAPKPVVDGVYFRLTKEDTTRPFVVSATALTRRQVDIRFNEPLDSLRFEQSGFGVTDTVTGRAIPILQAFLKRTQTPTAGLILGAPLDSPATYRVRVTKLFDRSGNSLSESNNSATFDGILRPDTMMAKLAVAGLRDSARSVRPDAPIELEFSDPVDHASLEQGILLTDSLRHRVRWRSSWEAPYRLLLRAEEPLWSNAWYRLSVVMDSVKDFREKRYRDSVFVLRFQTLDMKRTGEIEGQLVDGRTQGKPYRVSAETVDASPVVERTITVKGAGRFVFPQLIEGKYRIDGYEDADESGKYSFGKAHPFAPAERFAVFQDTVKVRARWGVQGVVLQFK